ncbi:hypothetical protein AXG89_33890 [Burkholderia sp. PAMC 26561]|nr:hypothetical protein AXG89_33890 [Burkholderia sp. PAMC 26561]
MIKIFCTLDEEFEIGRSLPLALGWGVGFWGFGGLGVGGGGWRVAGGGWRSGLMLSCCFLSFRAFVASLLF